MRTENLNGKPPDLPPAIMEDTPRPSERSQGWKNERRGSNYTERRRRARAFSNRYSSLVNQAREIGVLSLEEAAEYISRLSHALEPVLHSREGGPHA